jgi:Tol biopolymer transport system component
MRIDPFDRYMLGVVGLLLLVLGGVIALGDNVGAHVEDFSPTDGAMVATSTDIRITFAQPMDRDSVADAFEIEPDLEGTIRWRINTMIFTPDLPLIPGEEYVFRLGESARSLTGRRLVESVDVRFRTQVTTVYYLAPANSQLRSLWAVNSDGSAAREVFAPENGIFQFAPSPDGSRIAVTVFNEERNSADIWLISADGRDTIQLTDCQPGVCGQPSWSPNGDLLAYARQFPTETGAMNPPRIWLWDLSTDETGEVFEDSQVLGFDPTWNNDGSLLSFYDSNSTGIRIINLDTLDVSLVETDRADQWSFHPEDNTLAYTDLRTEDGWFYPYILTVNLDNGSESSISDRALLTSPEEDQAAVWSPDGEWLAFRRRFINTDEYGTGSHVMLYNRETGEARQVTTEPNFTNSNVAWSPSGDQLLFQRYELQTADFVPEVWLYDLETAELRLLATDAANADWLGGS